MPPNLPTEETMRRFESAVIDGIAEVNGYDFVAEEITQAEGNRTKLIKQVAYYCYMSDYDENTTKRIAMPLYDLLRVLHDTPEGVYMS